MMAAGKLVERASELEALQQALARAAEGEGRLALVSGEAGIGKTTLIDYFSEQCRGAVPVLWGACEALFTPRPLGPLYDIASQLSGALPDLHATEESRGTLFAAFLDILQKSPVVVVVEDAHWADEATLDLLKYVGRRIHRTRALLIVTYRSDEVGADHPLQFVLGELPRSHVIKIRPAALSEEAVAALARVAGHPDVPRLYSLTGGNPFYVTEVLAGRSAAVPETVREAVLARSVRLPAAARDVLNLASIVPTRIEHALLVDILNPDPAAIDACCRAGMLRLTAEGLSFRHELARLAFEEALPEAQRRALHARVLAVLRQRQPDQVPLARVVHHAMGAADRELILQLAPLAARQAEEVSAHREAASFYRAALQAADDVPPEERARLLQKLSYESYLTDQIEEALQAREDALDIWVRLGRREEQGENLRWMSRLNWFLGHKAEAEQYADRAVATLELLPPGAALAMAYSNRAQLCMLAEEVDRAVAWGSRAIALAEAFGAHDTLAHALNNVGTAELLAGNSRGVENLERSLALSLEHNLQEHTARAYTNLSSGFCVLHDYRRALPYLDEGISYSTDRDLDSWRLYMTAWRARVHFEMGHWTLAAEDADFVLGRYRAAPITRIPALAVLGHLRIRRGDPSAASLLDEAHDLAAETRELQRIVPVAAARAEAAWLQGHPDQALEEVRPAFELVLQHRNTWALGAMAFWMWRCGGLAEAPEHVAEPYRLQITGNWRAAAAAWETLGCPYEQAMALADGDADARLQALGLFERLGALPAAEVLRRRMRADHVRGIPRGPRPATRANPAGLTERQLDVLTLLADGLTNAEIAERLFISPKTAGHHVSAILAKLGAGTRHEAALYLHGRTPPNIGNRACPI